ncbi:hypothetical protein POTOM_025949 [Populus tomentosa]|uniref:RRM domain-containing protein n=1 Tax=Populus tomentosa TaxID=118781 RepID=A0A8X8CXT5_POPTO|nr:hypothetical protein POTOM_025949 [Populus tomentosa]
MRGRSYDYGPSPPRDYGRRHRNPSPRGRYGSRGRDLPTSLLVRNLRHDCRPEDLRGLFGRFGPLKDIYLPRDYYTGEPRGFGFVQYLESADAADAKHHMDGEILLGRELTVVFAEENRKKPAEMRQRDRVRDDVYRVFFFFFLNVSGFFIPWVVGTMTKGALHPRAMDGVTLVVLSIILLPPGEDIIQGLEKQYVLIHLRLPSRSISPRDRRYRLRPYSRSPHGSRSYSRSPVRSWSPYGSRSRSRSLEDSR